MSIEAIPSESITSKTRRNDICKNEQIPGLHSHLTFQIYRERKKTLSNATDIQQCICCHSKSLKPSYFGLFWYFPAFQIKRCQHFPWVVRTNLVVWQRKSYIKPYVCLCLGSNCVHLRENLKLYEQRWQYAYVGHSFWLKKKQTKHNSQCTIQLCKLDYLFLNTFSHYTLVVKSSVTVICCQQFSVNIPMHDP